MGNTPGDLQNSDSRLLAPFRHAGPGKGWKQIEAIPLEHYYPKDPNSLIDNVMLRLSSDTVSDPTTSVKKKKLKLITYNVWFGELEMETRNNAIFKILEEEEADIICLQEVTAPFVRGLIEQEWVCRKYTVVDINPKFVGSYGSYILWMSGSLPEVSLSLYPLPTTMDRNALIASFCVNNETFACCTVHLESLGTAPIRLSQIQIISQILKPSQNAVILGDFNFDSDINYDQLLIKRKAKNDPQYNEKEYIIPPSSTILENCGLCKHLSDYDDAWVYLKNDNPADKGYTFDSEVNKMCVEYGSGYEQMRYDRVMVKSRSEGFGWEPCEIRLLGTQSIQEGLWPSDHFGIVVTLVYKNDDVLDCVAGMKGR